MQSLIVPVLLLASAQQAPVSQPPKYIPPAPKPAVVKPKFAPTALFQLHRLLTPTLEAKDVLPRSKPYKPALRQPVYFSAPPAKRIVDALKANPKSKVTSTRQTFVHRVKYISASQAALAISNAFAKKHKIKITSQGIVADSPVVIVPEHPSNSLIISAAAKYVDEIKQLISTIDKAPKLFRIEATIKAVGADGKQIVARPKMSTYENQLMTVQVKNADGTSIELQLKIREVIQPQPSTPAVRKSTAGKTIPSLTPVVPATAAYRPIARNPSSAKLYRALSASYQPDYSGYYQPAYSPYNPKKTTDREKEIQQALEKKVSLHFEDGRLIDLVKYISKATGINVVFDQNGLEEEGLTKESKVTIDVDNIRLKSALNSILKPRRLAYKVEDEVLKITSKSRAKGPMTTVNYPVGNLLSVPSPDYATISFDTLIKLITSLIEPNSWSERGGKGAIHKFETTRSLVIRQTDQGHAKIKKLLDSLREAKKSKSE
jgi:hypothetical protein